MLLPNSYSFLLVRPVISKPVIQVGIQESETRRKMFLPNSHSFLLARSKKPVIQSDIQESATSLPSSFPSDSGGKMFLPNSHSFLLARSKKPVIQTGIQESATSLSRSAGRDPDLASGPSSSDSEDPSQSTIGDKNKRTFLKAAGIAGAGLAASLLLPQKAEALIMGSSPTTGVVGVKNAANTRINPATQETVSTLATEATAATLATEATAATILKTSDLALTAGVLDVKVTSTSGEGSSSFSNLAGDAKSGLVDAARHVQVDVLSSALPTSASTEDTLETISFGGVQFALRLATVGDIDYVGEAVVGTGGEGDAVWRIKKIDSSSGIVIKWADGDALLNHTWTGYAGHTYS